ncbi:MAG: HAD family hydrolase [Candidatus Woesearchaeota archaeon]
MNPFLIIDFNGALFKSRPFDEAHKRWFKLFSILLEDDSVLDWTFKENYFEGVHLCMKRYLGEADKETQTLFARQVYAMALIAETHQEDLVTEFAEYLTTIKERYTLVLLTSVPEEAALPMLRKTGCSGLFDIIYSTQSKNHPDKISLLSEFITKYGLPLFYIGLGDKDLGILKEMNIKTISVNWIEKGHFNGDYIIDSVDELRKIL